MAIAMTRRSLGKYSFLVMTEAQIAIGTLVNNRYQIQDILGQGGFGRTYLASNVERCGELCVLKLSTGQKFETVQELI